MPDSAGKHSIGTEKESLLHEALKFRYAGEAGRTEVRCSGYVCDGITSDGEIIEIQTGSFGPLKEKAAKLSARGPLRIVYPIVVTSYVAVYDNENTLVRRRKSPRRGSPWDLFRALVYAPLLPGLENLSVELALVDQEESRVLDGRGSWRRRRASVVRKRLLAFHASLVLSGPKDYGRFLPFKKNETFTSGDLADKSAGLEGLPPGKGISPALAQKTLYVLWKLGVIERISKQGRFWLYRRADGKKRKPKTP